MSGLFAVPRIEAFDALVPPDTKVAFHGVNKSGSLSMATTIRDAYAATGRSGEFFGHYFMSGMPLADYLRAVDALQGHRFLVAHYLYGSLPPRPGRVLVTQFRHPLPRLLSCYNWLKRKHEARRASTTFPSIEQWALQSRGRRYSQVMQFGLGFAPNFLDRLERMTARDLYENALDAIERDVFCFGIAERFEESIFLFAGLCRLPHVVPWVRDQRNPGRLHSSEVPPDTRTVLEDVFRYDFALYDRMLALFDQRLAGLDLGPDLEPYRRACESQYNDRILPARAMRASQALSHARTPA